MIENLKNEGFLKYLFSHENQLRGKLRQNYDLSKITWFRTGGPAQIFFQPEDEDDLSFFLKLLPKEIPIQTVGIGSNLLVRDGGIKGVVLRLSGKNFTNLKWIDEKSFIAGAGISDKKISMEACQKAVGGFHFYYGIPGSLGGALKMNAGANGVETSERVVRVRMIDRSGQIHEFLNQEMGYTYRHSAVDDDLIFLSAEMEGYRESVEDIQKKMDDVQKHRGMVQPVREKTGGSTFCNPEEMSAWQAIDKAGCRGLLFGDAQISQMHCNFMINKGQAKAYDLEKLGEIVREKVYEHFKILLNWEIVRVGDFEKGREVLAFCP